MRSRLRPLGLSMVGCIGAAVVVATDILVNAISDLIAEVLREQPGVWVLRVVSSLVVVMVVWAVVRLVVKAKPVRIELEDESPRKPIVIATFGPANRPLAEALIAYHKPRRLYLLATRGERGSWGPATELQADINGKSGEKIVELEQVADAFDVDSTRGVARQILERHKAELGDVSVDITGGTVPMSLGLLAAASQYGVDVTYMPPAQQDPTGRGARPRAPKLVRIEAMGPLPSREAEEPEGPDCVEGREEKRQPGQRGSRVV